MLIEKKPNVLFHEFQYDGWFDDTEIHQGDEMQQQVPSQISAVDISNVLFNKLTASGRYIHISRATEWTIAKCDNCWTEGENRNKSKR